MPDQKQREGYVRCDHICVNTQWRFEVESEELKVGVLIAETEDGPIHFGMNPSEAEHLLDTLRLFLQTFDAKPS
jgi:hypothetical protein